jgi:hypothetical protein
MPFTPRWTFRRGPVSKMNSKIIQTVPQVYIIESLGFDDEAHRKEGEVISRTLRMLDKDPIYHYIRTEEEFEHFLAEFYKSNYRYLHLSCHGNSEGIAFTFGSLSAEDLILALAPVLKNKRLFLSACDVATTNLARGILGAQPGSHSIAGPIGEVTFADSAILWSAFYHTMFSHNPGAMKRDKLYEKLTLVAQLTSQGMQLFTYKDGRVIVDHCL